MLSLSYVFVTHLKMVAFKVAILKKKHTLPIMYFRTFEALQTRGNESYNGLNSNWFFTSIKESRFEKWIEIHETNIENSYPHTHSWS